MACRNEARNKEGMQMFSGLILLTFSPSPSNCQSYLRIIGINTPLFMEVSDPPSRQLRELGSH